MIKNNLSRWLNERWAVLDKPMLWMLAGLMGMGMVNMWSATSGTPTPVKFFDQLRNFGVAFMLMWTLAHLPPQTLMRFAIPAYLVGVVLLVGVALVGEVSKGSRRWLNLGITRIQPSEISKIAVPLMLSWYFSKHETLLRVRDFFIAAFLLLIPFVLIAKQPDLGTALLVGMAGFYVIYFAGLSFKLLAPIALAVIVGISCLSIFETKICQDSVVWPLMHDYQKQRICTLLDPSSDPLGKGFHTLQSMIAVGSGGFLGKGFMHGTQAQLEFIPERSTDFAYAVFAEEWGFIGSILLMGFYIALLLRGLMIATHAPTLFTRLLSGSLTLVMFTYAAVNMGMVIGVLPVVGVPMPFISYGGTALLTLGVACGILMSVQRHRNLVQN
jgi:rod shape determining protein RodA